ncbi:MAG: tetratricopeptide repeat protein, partial [Phycisphaerales bacterium JB038]
MEQWRRASDEDIKAQALQRAEQIREAYLPYTSSAEEDASMWMLDGQLAHARRNHAEAVRLLQMARTAHVNFPTTLKQVLADSLAQRGQLGDAQIVLSEAFEDMSPLNTTWPSVWATLIDYQRQLDMGEATCDTIEEVLQYYPADSEIAQQLMNVHQQVAAQYELENRLGAFGPIEVDPRQQMMDRIRSAIDDGESSDVLEPLVLQYATAFPDDLQAQLVKARFYQSLGEEYAETTIAAYREVLRLDPTNREAELIIQVQEGADPVELIIREIESDPNLAPVQREIGKWKTYSDAGRTAEADAALAAARRLDATNPDLIEIEFVKAVGEEDWETAQARVDTARELNIDQASGATFEGRLKLSQGDPQAALTLVTQAIELNPLNTELYMIRAQAYRQIGNLAGAVGDMQRAYASRPTDARIARMLADVLRQRSEFEAALEVARPAHKRHPNDEGLTQIWLDLERQAGDSHAVTDYLREAYEENPANIDVAHRLAAWLIEQDDFEGADGILQRIEAAEPEALRTLTLRAVWHSDQGSLENIDAGRDVYIQHIENAAPETLTSKTYGELASYLLAHGREAEAADWLKASLPLQSPETHEVDMALGQVYFRAQRYEDAIRHYRAVIGEATAPSEQAVELAHLAILESLINLDRIAEAEQELQAYRANSKPTLGQFLLEAKIHQSNGDLPKARQALDRGVAAEPSNHFAYYQRALFNANDMTMHADVLADLARAIEINPGYRLARTLRIQVLIEDGKIEQALNEQKQLLDFFPKDKRLRLDYASNLEQRGLAEEHLQVLMEGRELFPDDAEWYVQMSNWHAARGNGERATAILKDAYETVSDRHPTVGMYYAAILLWEGEFQDAELSRHILQRHADELIGNVDYYLIDARALKALDRMDEAKERMREAWEFAKLDDRTVIQDAMYRWANSITTLYPLDLEGALELTNEVIGEEDVPAAVLLIYCRHYADNVAGIDQRLIEIVLPMVDDEKYLLRARVTGAMFLGSLYYREEQYQDAVDLYEHVLYDLIPPLEEGVADIYPLARIECLNNLAYIYADLLDKPEAAEDPARQVVALRPGDANVLDTLGHVLFKMGQL